MKNRTLSLLVGAALTIPSLAMAAEMVAEPVDTTVQTEEESNSEMVAEPVDTTVQTEEESNDTTNEEETAQP